MLSVLRDAIMYSRPKIPHCHFPLQTGGFVRNSDPYISMTHIENP